MWLNVALIWKLELLHELTVHLVIRVSCKEHKTQLLKDLHWLPVRFQVDFKMFVWTYNALKDQSQICLKVYLSIPMMHCYWCGQQ